MNTSGFYNNKGDYAKNGIWAPSYTILAEKKETYVYPVNGWTWYESVEEAQQKEGFDIEIVDYLNGVYINNINNLNK